MKNHLVVTLLTPEYMDLFNLTFPHLETYAWRCNADVRVHEDDSLIKPPHFKKFKLLRKMAMLQYESVLYIDADVYVRKNAPNIFTAVEETSLFNERPHPHPPTAAVADNWITKNLDPTWDGSRYFNTGVMLFRKDDLEKLCDRLRCARIVPGPFYEQCQLNHLIKQTDIPVRDLPQVWNQSCGWRWINPTKAAAAYFLHGNGVDGLSTKLNLLRNCIEKFP